MRDSGALPVESVARGVAVGRAGGAASLWLAGGGRWRGQDRLHAGGEGGFGELFGPGLEGARPEAMFFALELRNGGQKRAFIGRLIENAAKRVVYGDAFEEAAAAESDDGLAAGQGFHGGDAKIFLAGYDQGARSSHEAAQVFVGNASAELDASGGHAFETFEFRPVADDAEAAAGALERAHGHIDALVGHQLGYDQVIIFRFPAIAAFDIHGRMDDAGFAAPGFLDTPRDVLAVRDELIHA